MILRTIVSLALVALAALSPSVSWASAADGCQVASNDGQMIVSEANNSGSQAAEAEIGAICSDVVGSGQGVGISKYALIPSGWTWECRFLEQNGASANVWVAPTIPGTNDGADLCSGLDDGSGNLIWLPAQAGLSPTGIPGQP